MEVRRTEKKRYGENWCSRDALRIAARNTGMVLAGQVCGAANSTMDFTVTLLYNRSPHYFDTFDEKVQ